jgi:hypothetical protein
VRTPTITSRPLALLCLAALTAGCAGDYLTRDRSATLLVIDILEGTSGATGNQAGTLESDVQTFVDGSPTVFSDAGVVSVRAIMKNPGTAQNPVAPGDLNAITITRYRVTFRRSDGRNTPGVDVPHPFDSGTTFSVSPGTIRTHTFELIRHTAKLEAPLAALRFSPVIISTIADITFYGHDQAGSAVSVTGSMGVLFGDFGDPG